MPGWRLALPDSDIVAFARREWRLDAEELAVLHGDFDGNGRTDFAVHLTCGPNNLERRLVVVLDTGRGYRIRVLDAGEPTGQRYLRLARRGIRWINVGTGKTIVFAHDTIQMNTFEKAGRSYLYRAGRFQPITTSD